MRDPEKTVGNMADKASVVTLTYVDAQGYPVAKAMLAPRRREGIKTFWLTTNTSSNKVACLRQNPQASLYWVDRRFFRGVSLCGTVEVLEDAESKQLIWREGDTMYYPAGVTDPDYCVLKFTAVKGRYYSNFKNEDFSIE